MCTDVFILVETNVVLMLMRSPSSLEAGSGIEFLLGNRSNQDVHTHFRPIFSTTISVLITIIMHTYINTFTDDL